jgi:outer membrane protein TolC
MSSKRLNLARLPYALLLAWAAPSLAAEAEPEATLPEPTNATSEVSEPEWAPESSPDRYTPPAFITEPATLAHAEQQASAWPLTRGDLLARLLGHNLGLQIQRETVRHTQLGEQSANGAFEPTVSATYRHRDANTPPSNQQEGSAGDIITNIDNSWTLGATDRLKSGTRIDLNFNNNWSQSSQGNAIRPDLYRSSVDLTLTQPFLRGFSLDGQVQSASILRARFASRRALEQARLTAATLVMAAENAYWDLVEALKSYQVRLASLELAKNQLELTQRQIQAGVLPPSDLINAEGTLARRELGLVEAEASIERNADRLRELMNLPGAEWHRPILARDTPEFVELRPNVPALIARAEEKRPQLQQAELALAQARLDSRVADNQNLPALDASLSGGLVGQDSTYSAALTELRGGRGRYWSAFVSLTLQPFAELSGAEAERAAASSRRAKLERELTLSNIRVEIRQAARALETAERQLYAAARSRRLAERSLSAEERKFANGMSNNFFVAERQEQLAQAQLAELSALIRHEKARGDLQLATGELLEARNVRLELAP